MIARISPIRNRNSFRSVVLADAPAFHDVVMRRSAVEPRQQLARLRRDDGDLVVGTRKRTHGIQSRKPHDGYELDLFLTIAADQVDALKAIDLPSDSYASALATVVQPCQKRQIISSP